MEKVAGFVTRDVRVGPGVERQLLVFRHANPRAGIQIPAGTVEWGEAVANAVLREVHEETGLTALSLAGHPVRAPLELGDGEWYLDLNSGQRETMRRLGLAHPRVRISAADGDRVLLAAEGMEGQPIHWWADQSAVTRDIRRWLVHLKVSAPAPDHWERAFDEPEPWAFFWVGIHEDPGLIGRQAEWLRIMRSHLREFSHMQRNTIFSPLPPNTPSTRPSPHRS